jgi:transcriptional regulator of met regulon
MPWQSLPMYRLIASTISACASYTGDYPVDALTSLKEANVIFQNTSRFFFENMKDANISHALWLAYLQGYTGWALPGDDGVVISGVSGGHSLTIRTLDAFLGIKPAPPPEEEALHLPVAQRDWLDSLREVRRFMSHAANHRLNSNLPSMTSAQKSSRLLRSAWMLRIRHWSFGRRCATNCRKWSKSFGYGGICLK